MKVSKELEIQLKRLSNTGSFRVNEGQKKELKELAEFYGAHPLTNFSCGTCVRDTMNSLNRILKQKEIKPVLSFKGVKKPEEMKFTELKKALKDKGIKFSNKDKKEDLIIKLNASI